MKALILTCNTGGGHNSAAKALQACFASRGVTCDIKNALQFFHKGMEKIISNGHVFCYRHLPKAFGVGYRMAERHPKSKFIYRFNAHAAEPLYQFILAGGYDTVICVHIFTELMMTEIRRKFGLQVRQYFVATDYTCSPGCAAGDMDAYFVPKFLTPEFAEKGVDASKVVESGIPVGTSFNTRVEKQEARRQLGLPEDGPLVIMMCGSMGCGPIEELAQGLAKSMPPAAQLAIFCGSNEKLSESLAPMANERIRILGGFGQPMSLWMDAADLFLTKPGGLSSSEALTKHLPMVCINAVPGCETRNLDYFAKYGLAKTTEGVDALLQLTLDSIEHPEQMDEVRENIRKIFDFNAVENIVNFVMDNRA